MEEQEVSRVKSTPEERGKNAEEAFFKAWENRKFFKPWMVSVERPTIEEDLYQKTDAVIVTVNGPNLKIQIKNHRVTPELINDLSEEGIVLLCIYPSYSAKEIRKKTMMSINFLLDFIRNKKQKNFSQEQKQRKVSGNFFYKKGRRHNGNNKKASKYNNLPLEEKESLIVKK